MQWFLQALRRFSDFSGRSRRREFGWFVLVAFGAAIMLAVLDQMLGFYSESTGIGLLSGLLSLVLLVPGIAVMVRRFHDMGRTG